MKSSGKIASLRPRGVGAALWRVLHDMTASFGLADTVGPSPDVYVIVGMVAVFGAVSHAPIAMLLMVAEMTQNLALVPPAMLALMVSSLIMGERTIYRSQLGTRRDDPAGHRAPELVSSAMPYEPGGQTP